MTGSDLELLDVFLEEANENLAVIESGLLVLERKPEDAAIVDEIFRAAHTLKGGAATLSLTALRDAANALEDFFAALRDKRVVMTPVIAGVPLCAVDLLRALLEVPELSDGQRALVDELRRLAEGGEVPTTTSEGGRPMPCRREAGATFLRVCTEKLDRMLDLSAEIAVARSWFRQHLPAVTNRTTDIVDREEKLQAMERELQDLVMAARMVPLEPLFQQMTRTVRDAAQACGKSVQLLIDGGDVEIDTRIVELIRDPLMHLVRNAVDHGIEEPSQRFCKRDAGTVRLSARRDGPGLAIDVADDGRGFNRHRIVARARALGMISADARPSDDEILAFVFRPGFSTADETSGISGRGVGLDVVQKNIGTLRGSIHVQSEEGVGSTISIRLPLTLAMVTALPLHAGGETFVLPLDSVVECAVIPPGGALELRGESVAALSLADALDLPPGRASQPVAVVVRHAAGKVALIVDAVSETVHALIRPLGKLFAGIPFIAGATVLSSGKVALILDVENVINRRKSSCCEE